MSHNASPKIRSLAVLTGGANKLPYFSGTDDLTQADITAAGLALIDDASASAQRTTLGLVIGTDVQAFDASLLSLAALATGADKLPYATGVDTYAEATLTAAGRAILDDANAAAQRVTLGVEIGVNVQAFDAQLSDVAGLAVTDGNFIVGNGTNFVAESGATARSSLGLGSADSPSFASLTLSGDLTVQGTRTTVLGEKTAFADNYLDINANYVSEAAVTCGQVYSYDPAPGTAAENVAGNFVAGVASTSNPTIEVADTTGFAAGQIIRVQGSTSNDGFYEVNGLLTAPVRIQVKGIGTVATVEDWTSNQLTAEVGAGSVTLVNVAVFRVGTDGVFESGKGSTVPLTYTDFNSLAAGGSGDLSTVNAGDTAAAGSVGKYADAGHQHPVATAAAAALDSASSAAEGSSVSLARADHTHSVASAVAIALGGAAAPATGVAGGFAKADHDHGNVPLADGNDWGSSTKRWDLFSKARIRYWQEKSGAYTVAATDDGIRVTTTATITLPDITTFALGQEVEVKSAGGVTTTIARTGTDTIDGATSASLGAYAAARFSRPPTGTDWQML